ncbi:MAG: DMT family transporter [Anaerolineales bacterium]
MTPKPSQSSPTNPIAVLVIGLFAVSTAAIFIRLAQQEGVSSLEISGARLLIAALVLTPWVLRRHLPELRRLSAAELGLCALAGAVLSGHFAAWISSLEYTSVTASVVLVTTNPLFVALLSVPLLGEHVSRPVLLGILLAFLGSVIVALSGDAGNPPTRPDALLGNGLAVLGAVAAALYFIIGRRLRAKLSIFVYIWLVYSAAAVCMLVVLGLQGAPVAQHSALGYVWLLALGLIPQLIGHSAFNYALGYLPAAFVSLVVLGEPIGSTILAVLVLGEVPSLPVLLGAAVILTGIAIGSRQPRAKPQTTPPNTQEEVSPA